MSQFPVRVCSWQDVSLSEAELLLEACADTERLQSQLAGRLGAGEGKRALIERDLFTYAVLFCKKNDFSPEQLSAFFTILKSLHCMCISTPYDNIQDTFVYFRELVLCHSIHRPPFSTCLFSLAQVKAITDYVLSTYFKHFKLYKYAFTKRVQLNMILSYSGEQGKEAEEMGVGLGDQEGVGLGEGEQEGDRERTHSQTEPGEKAEDVVEEEEGTDSKRQEEEGKGEEGEREEELSAEQQRLRHVITATLTSHLKQLKVSVDQQMGEHEKRLSERISHLEASADWKPKKK